MKRAKIISSYEICNLNIFFYAPADLESAMCARHTYTHYQIVIPFIVHTLRSHYILSIRKNVNYLKIYYCVFITFVCVLALTMARVYFTYKEQIEHAAPAAEAAATTTTAATAKRKTTMYVYIKI